METVSQLRTAGFTGAADTLKSATKYVTSSGWEWLGELGLAAQTIQKGNKLPDPLAARVSLIVATATSKRPYG